MAAWSLYDDSGVDFVALAAAQAGGVVVASNVDAQLTTAIRWFDANGSEVSSVLWLPTPGNQVLARDIATDPSGNVYVTGVFDGDTDVEGTLLQYPACPACSGLAAFLVKFDPLGAPLWAKGFAAGGDLHGSRLAVDAAGNVHLAGYVHGPLDFGGGLLSGGDDRDVYLVKFDPGGNHIWSRRYGDGAAQHLSDVEVTGAGGVVLVGLLVGVMDFGGGGVLSGGVIDGYVARLDASGQHVWSRTGVGGVQGAAFDSGGHVYTTGTCFGTIAEADCLSKLSAESGELLWTEHWGSDFPFHLGVDDACDNVTVVGHASTCLAKRGPDGEVLADWTLGPSGDAIEPSGIGLSSAFDAEGNVYHAHKFSGTVDFGAGPMTSDDAAFLVRFVQQ